MASIEIVTNAWPVRDVLPLLLTDRSAKKNIIFATDSYAERGEDYGAKRQITEQALNTAGGCIIQPRVLKDADEQLLRTRKKAEVFTPAWVCCLMIDQADEDWFGRPNVFGQLNGQEWTPEEGPIQMPKLRRWQTYVDSRRLEITCGEAPFLVSRYDMATGEIIPIKDRIGILDRKLRIVNENTATEEEWLKWTLRAFQAVYGYEYQGDNVLVARINLLWTYIDYMQDRWDRKPTGKELEEIAKVISWNLWQMDGLKGSIPLGALYEQYHQLTIFDIFGMDDGTDEEEPEEYIPCRVFDWRGQNKSVEFNAFRERRNGSMKFDFIIGNPPYQEAYEGESSGANSIYDKFMDGTFEISDHVELITPGRFLFNAGSTPKAWNAKMLSDQHFKVLHYESDASKFFPNVIITGGIAVSYRDAEKNFGAIETFTAFEQLNSILRKIKEEPSFSPISEIAVTSFAYHFTDKMHHDHPEAAGMMSKGHAYDLKSNCFKTLSHIFTTTKQAEDDACILGRDDNGRAYRYIKRVYINDVINFDKFKVFLSKADGASGTIGNPIPARIVGTSEIGKPHVGSTESFLSIGNFETLVEAENLTKYIKTRFARAALGILKVTQDITPTKWKFVPNQDFTASSDIDWSQSVAGIDRQLYTKYGLSDDEITFIETYVKEME